MQQWASLFVFTVLMTVSYQQVPPNFESTIACEQAYETRFPITSSEAPVNITLQYSVADIPALEDLQSRYSNKLLISQTAKYTRLMISIPSYSNRSFVTTGTINVEHLGLSFDYDGQIIGSDCLLLDSDCTTNPCQTVQKVPVQVFSSPVRLVYTLTPVKYVPFSFQPYDLTVPQVCQNQTVPSTAGSCLVSEIRSSSNPTSGACSTPGVIQSLYGDVYNGTQNCGSYSDPGIGFSEMPFDCLTTCISCNGAPVPRTEHRRWWSSPTCSIWRIADQPSWDALIAIVVGNYTLVDTLSFQASKSRDIILGKKRLIRAYLAQSYLNQYTSSLQRVSGFIVMCNYSDPNAANSLNQGLFNPYVNVSAAIAAAKAAAGGDVWKLLLADMIAAAPVNLTPDQRGAGKVPTYNSTGQYSIFYIPDTGGPTAKTTRENAFPGQSAMSQLLENADLTACNSGNTNACLKGIPGWYIDPATGNYSIPSVCQLSDNINRYAAQYKANFASGPTAGNAAASIPSGIPLGLLPMFNISQPNVWIDNGNLIIDSSNLYPVKSAFTIALDISYDMFTFVDSPTGLVVTSGRSSCIYDNKNGNGSATIQLANPNNYGLSPIEFGMNLTCAWYFGNYIQPAAVNYTGPKDLFIDPRTTFTSAPFLITSPPLTNGTLECLLMVDYVNSYYELEPVQQVIECGLVANFDFQPYPTPMPSPSGLSAGGIIAVIAVGIVAVVGLAGLVVVLVVHQVSKKKAGKRD